MLYAYILENGTLAATDDLRNVPEEYRERVVEFPGLSPDAGLLTVRDGKPALKGEDEIRREERERALARLRAERNQRLAATDWVVVRAAERGEEVPAEWRAYRQALRDLPQAVGEEALLSGNIPWPEPPQFPK